MSELNFKKPIIFFDGFCGLCNTVVDFVLKHDKKNSFFYSPIQGKTAEKILNPEIRTDLSTFVFWEKGKLYTRSAGFFKITAYLGFPWNLWNLFWIVPWFIRDGVYQFIAHNRYSWFGKNDVCRLPSPEERALFLE